MSSQETREEGGNGYNFGAIYRRINEVTGA
jgi:hypothetical protein